MNCKARRLVDLRPAVAAVTLLLAGSAGNAQVTVLAERNMSRMSSYQNECAIAQDPTNKDRLFSLCNTAGAGLFAARSTDGGGTWTFPDPSRTIANGVNPALGPAACCDPTLAWDTFGNLFVVYVDSGDVNMNNNVVVLLSSDAGQTFTTLAQFGPASVDQPTVTADSGEVWVVWNEQGSMVARGAAVTGLGTAGIGAFGALQTIPGTLNCSFGDVAISPAGAVVQVCENPTQLAGPGTLIVNVKGDGLGPNPFSAPVATIATNVGGRKPIPAQSRRSIDAEAGFAYDRNPASPHFGRLYLVYTDEVVLGNNDTDIMVRFSDDDGAHWSNPPIRVNDDPPGSSQFLPRIATNRLSGNVAVCWHDARNSPSNSTMQEFCSIATPAGASPVFLRNAQVSGGTSDGNGDSLDGVQFGDYSGLAYFQGHVHPAWADDSNSTGDNPDGTTRYDAQTSNVIGGPAAMEGEPHLTTVDGVHYDFQGAGEFVILHDYGGTKIQVRQAPIATTFNPGPDRHDGLAMCVSLITAVAAQVGRHRVTYEPGFGGGSGPSALQLRVDGVPTALGPAGIDLGDGGRIAPTAAPAGLEIHFPDDTLLRATPGFWALEGVWGLNVNVTQTAALEGLVGAVSRGGWLPALPDGSTMGPMPGTLHQRYLDLYRTFAEAWRVTDKSSLFDYAPGTSTATFTRREWPPEQPPCLIPGTNPADPASPAAAEAACLPLVNGVAGDPNVFANCFFDVLVTGNLGFAEVYLLSHGNQTAAPKR